jgi:mevalonate kinase
MTTARGAGCGKVILLGEHSVVHGRPALAAGLSRGATAEVCASADGHTRARFVFDTAEVDVLASADSEHSLGRALWALLATYESPPPVQLTVRLELPAGAGLGASAAMGVAVSAALDQLLGVARTPEERATQTLAWERVFHGNPSGVDNTMAAVGGVAFFTRGQPLEPVRVRRPLVLVIGHSGEASETKQMVGLVAQQLEREPKRIGELFDAIAALVRNGRLAVEAGDLRALGQLMDMNHGLLSALMLSTPRLEDLCHAAREAGALGAKVTGAGGGGCMFALAADTSAAHTILAALQSLGAESFITEVGA